MSENILPTWSEKRQKFIPPRETDPVFVETMIQDLELAISMSKLYNDHEMVDKMVEAYKLKTDSDGETVPVEEDDFESLKTLFLALKDEKGTKLGVAEKLAKNGFNEDLLLKVLFKSKKAVNSSWGVQNEENASDGEDEPQEMVWYEGMYNDMSQATRGLRVWKDSKDHSKGQFTQAEMDADKQLIRSARKKLMEHGLNVSDDDISNETFWKRVRQARGLAIDGLQEKAGEMTKIEAEEIIKELNIDVEKVIEEKIRLRNSEGQKNRHALSENDSGSVRSVVDEDAETELRIYLSMPAGKEKNTQISALLKSRVRISPELRKEAVDALTTTNEIKPEEEFRRIKEISLPNEQMRMDMLRNWYRKHGTADLPQSLLGEANDLMREVELRVKMPETPGLPERDDKEGWLRWGRRQLADYLNPDMDEVLRRTKGDRVFQIEKDTLLGKTFVDGMSYVPDEVKALLEKERKMVMEMRQMYFRWNRAHKGIGAMASIFEVKDESSQGYYSLPDNKQLGAILNDLCGEKMEDGKGSHNVAIAVRIYYEMALSRKPIRKTINGTEITIPCIFNTQLSKEDLALARSNIAGLCGGDYYESLGLMISKFFGFAARGYDNHIPAIDNSDIMGRLIWTSKINRYEGEEGRLDPGERPYRWLPDEIANNFVVVDSRGNYVTENGRSIPIEFSVDVVTLQNRNAKGKRGYYIAKSGSEYKLVKTEGGLTSAGLSDSGLTMDRIIMTDQLDKIDWAGSTYGIMGLMRYQESQALDLYNMFNNLISEKQAPVLVKPELIKRRDTIDYALNRYSKDVGDYLGYLYVYSILYRHTASFLISEKGKDSVKEAWTNQKKAEVVRFAKEAGLITKDEEKKLRDIFRLGVLRF